MLRKKVFNDQSLNDVFTNLNYEYEDMRQLMIDTAKGEQKVAKKEAEDAIRGMMFQVLNLNPEDVENPRRFKRALKHNKDRFFEVIEDVVNDMLTQGFEEDPFMMRFVDTKNLSNGDKNEFYAEQDIILTVAEVSGDHHDIFLQRLGEGDSYSVKTSVYAAAVGTDLRLFLSGRKDWSALINAVYRAFDNHIKNTLYKEVMNVGAKLPVGSIFNKANPLTAAFKDDFDDLISYVSAANDNCEVVIFGTQKALKKLGKLTDIDWVSNNMKDKLHETGRLGIYEGTDLIEIPQRLIRKGNTLEKLIKDDQLLVMPVTMDKWIKFVNVGDDEIVEVTERGARMDDTMIFEYQKRLGVGAQIGRYFGNWKITE